MEPELRGKGWSGPGLRMQGWVSDGAVWTPSSLHPSCGPIISCCVGDTPLLWSRRDLDDRFQIRWLAWLDVLCSSWHSYKLDACDLRRHDGLFSPLLSGISNRTWFLSWSGKPCRFAPLTLWIVLWVSSWRRALPSCGPRLIRLSGRMVLTARGWAFGAQGLAVQVDGDRARWSLSNGYLWLCAEKIFWVWGNKWIEILEHSFSASLWALVL